MFYHNFSFTNNSVNSLYALRPPILYSRISISFCRLLLNLLVILRSFYFTVSVNIASTSQYSRMTIPDCFRILYIFPYFTFPSVILSQEFDPMNYYVLFCLPGLSYSHCKLQNYKCFFSTQKYYEDYRIKKLSKRGKNVFTSNCLISAANKT